MMHAKTSDGRVYAFVRMCTKVRTIDELNRLIQGDLRELLPHEMAAYGLVSISDWQTSQFVNVSFPEDYMRSVRSAEVLRLVARMADKEWHEPEFFTIDELSRLAPAEWMQAARDHDLRNIAWHAVRDVGGVSAAYFKFSRLHFTRSAAEVKECLTVVVPHLYAALSNVLADTKTEKPIELREADVRDIFISAGERTKRLSAREAEVLTWLYYGKTNSEIAGVLNTSVFTVKNHVQNILMKLGANNRTQAVCYAIRAGLLRAREL